MADQYGNLSPEEYQQQQQINRQQKMAQMLLQNTQQPQGQMVSGRFVPPSFFQNILPLVNMYQGQRLAEQGDVKAAALAEAIRGREAKETKNILEKQFGSADYKPAVMPQIQRDDMGNVMPAVQNQVGQAANPQEALMAALKSQGRTGQMIGQTLLAQKLKPPEQFNLRENEKRFIQNPDGSVREIAQGSPKEIKYPAQIELALTLDRSLPRDPATWTQADADKANSRIEKHIKASAPNMTSINNVMAFEPFANKVQSKMGEGLVEQYGTLKNIPIEIANLNKAATLAPKSFAGTFAQQKTDAAKFFNNNFGTKIAVDKVNNTEELGSRLFQSTMENLKKMDASPSQYQQKVMQQAFGTITTDPSSLPKIIEIQKEALTSKAKQHNLQVLQSQQGPAQLQFPYNITIPLEESQNTGQFKIREKKQ
jgi:hypothetical protein